jgi:hypothetical protein
MHYSSLAQDVFAVAVAALALAPTAAAHGHIKEITVNGKSYSGAIPVGHLCSVRHSTSD